ncbi:MAG: sigma-70 family RNA polymerase sigma factor [Clostridia bacterium]|nr:sigma-70 family RNA polymerase sigma factor [Clostridia bacterium]
MNDQRIIDLFWQRDESAIRESSARYGSYLLCLAQRILSNREDAMECVNDTYLAAWNTIPPQRPAVLSAYLGRLTRNLSLKRLRHNTAEKRGGGITPIPLDELGDCIPDTTFWQKEDSAALGAAIDAFLRTLPPTEQRVFVSRYWHLYSIKEIAHAYAMRESRVKMMLLRTRGRLRAHLEQEGFTV